MWFDNKADVHKGIVIATGMIYIEQPLDLLSMFVCIVAEVKEMDYRCIIPVEIPQPDDEDFSELKRIQRFFTDSPLYGIVIKPMPFEFTMAFPTPYSKSWQELNKLR